MLSRNVFPIVGCVLRRVEGNFRKYSLAVALIIHYYGAGLSFFETGNFRRKELYQNTQILKG